MKNATGYILTLAAMLVAAPRYAGAMAQAAGYSLEGVAWFWVETASGLGFAVLEAVVIAYATRAWSECEPGRTRNALGGLVIVTFALLAVMVTPYVRATVTRQTVGDILDNAGLWAWAFAVGVSPIVVMALSGVTEHVTRRYARRNGRDGAGVARVTSPVTGDVTVSRPKRNALRGGITADVTGVTPVAGVTDAVTRDVTKGVTGDDSVTEGVTQPVTAATLRQRAYRARKAAKGAQGA